MKYPTTVSGSLALKSAISVIAAASVAGATTSTVFAGKASPYTMANESWITLSGEVESVTADQFTLDYRDGHVIVEMDDGDRDADAYKLLAGDKVSVTGKIDHDLFETTSIEASAVYVKNLGTTFFASAVDEEDRTLVASYVTTPLNNAYALLEGSVTTIEGDEFVLDTGIDKITVDVDDMPYDPLDDEGYQKINVGDEVKVTGRFDHSLFDGLELEADTIIKLSANDSTRSDNRSAMSN